MRNTYKVLKACNKSTDIIKSKNIKTKQVKT